MRTTSLLTEKASILESRRGQTALRLELFALWLTYAAAAAFTIWLAERCVGGLPRRCGLLLAALPLVFTGKAMVFGELYGPADLISASEPWSRASAGQGVPTVRNPILSDLAFANLPWRAAVRESLSNGRLPFWNRFALAGNPLLGSASAAVFHPSTWLGIFLPLALSWTFSCTFTLFVSLLSAFLFFRDFRLSPVAASIGAAAWGFSTYLVFWDGWSVGMSTASLPLLLLGVRRIADGRRGVAIAVAGFLLSFFGGHPESTFHGVAVAIVFFAWDLADPLRRGARRTGRAVGSAALAGVLALLFGAVQLFPLVEAISHSAEYRARQGAVAREAASQSVPLAPALRRLLPDLLPFAHGIYGRSSVQAWRQDGAGMPLGYAGAVTFPLALLALSRKPRVRGRSIFLVFTLFGLAYGASFPGVLDLTTRLPGFALALNYRLVFLAGLGLAGLAAFGAQALEEPGAGRRLAGASGAVVAILVVAGLASASVFRARELPDDFIRSEFAAEIVPLVVLGCLALVPRVGTSRLGAAVLVVLVAQRGFEMGATYPTLPVASLAPPLSTLAAMPIGSSPSRIVAVGELLRPNTATLYDLEDVRGYEAVVLDRFVDTFPLWSAIQPASFNRVDELTPPFLSFLNVRYAVGRPLEPPPAGWIEQARGAELSIFTNPGALARAFVPRTLVRASDTLAAMAEVGDFAATAFLGGNGLPEEPNGSAALDIREVGPDLVVAASASSRAFVATSLPDWPGWTAESEGRLLPVETVNHAFVGFWVEPGEHTVRLRYRPRTWTLAIGFFLLGLAFASALAAATSRGRSSIQFPSPPGGGSGLG